MKRPRGGVPDGMKVDAQGNIYSTGSGGVWIFAPDGTQLGIIEMPQVPANLCFGGADGKTLFITAQTSVYAVRVKIAGDKW
jgi:gluconolactonase